MVLPEKSSDRKNWKRNASDRNRRNRIRIALKQAEEEEKRRVLE